MCVFSGRRNFDYFYFCLGPLYLPIVAYANACVTYRHTFRPSSHTLPEEQCGHTYTINTNEILRKTQQFCSSHPDV